LLKGPIPNGYVIDHLCGMKACAYPDHLEAVTLQENSRRGGLKKRDFCNRGHPMSGSNLRIEHQFGGRHVCRACEVIREQRRDRRRRGRGRPGPGQEGLF
jgi:hypothetical protein